MVIESLKDLHQINWMKELWRYRWSLLRMRLQCGQEDDLPWLKVLLGSLGCLGEEGEGVEWQMWIQSSYRRCHQGRCVWWWWCRWGFLARRCNLGGSRETAKIRNNIWLPSSWIKWGRKKTLNWVPNRILGDFKAVFRHAFFLDPFSWSREGLNGWELILTQFF